MNSIFRKQRVGFLRAKWNVPRRHIAAEENLKLEGKWFETFERIKNESGKGYLRGLIGKRGTGKTQIAVQLMFDQTENLRSARYTTAMELFIRIKDTFHQKRSEKEIIDEMKKADFLVIDELGKTNLTQWENNIIFDIINDRYNQQKDTLLIDNSSPAEFSKLIGDSLVSRMNETGAITVCNWPSFRKGDA